jgi:hypothetical protein
MKKIVLSICGIAVIAVAGINVYIGLSDNVKFSSLMLSNIVALGQGEVYESGCGATEVTITNTYKKEGGNDILIERVIKQKCWKGSGSSCEEGTETTNFVNNVTEGSFSTIYCD